MKIIDRVLIVVLLCWASSSWAQQNEGRRLRPNILWITCEDLSPHLGCYGDSIVSTPTLDKLAAHGVRYTNVFATAGVCAPSRSAIITGMYQQSIGTQHMRTLRPAGSPDWAYPPGLTGYSAVVPAGVKCFPEYLRAAGYYCSNNAKEDYQFIAPLTVWDESSPNAHWRNRKDGNQAFFSVFNFMTTHESQVWARAKEPLMVDPDKVLVPPYYPDIPEVRKDIARHLTNVMVLDKQVGELLHQLEEDGLTDNTIIFFFSDHGDGLPYVKRELYDRGLKVPFLIQFAENFPALNHYDNRKGIVDDQLISFVDLAPTMLSLTGIEIPGHLQGQAFLGKARASKKREYIFAARDRMDSEYDRVRIIRDQRYLYMLNYMQEKPYYQNIRFRLQQPMMGAILKLKEDGKLNDQQMSWFRITKPREELYDCEKDPYQFINLADDPTYREKLVKLRKAFDTLNSTFKDKSDLPEPEMIKKWWDGKPNPPETNTPSVEYKAGIVALTCKTPGASIGYKLKREESWRPYSHPFRISAGDSLLVIAHRIGYVQSAIIKKRY